MVEESILHHEIRWPLTHLMETRGQNEKGRKGFETLPVANSDNYTSYNSHFLKFTPFKCTVQ